MGTVALGSVEAGAAGESAAMARRALKLASFGTITAAAGVYLYNNKRLDPNDFGVIRVGRTVATTAVITLDYLTSLRSIPHGTEEYDHVKSQYSLRIMWL
ncbi:hypothetical protein JRQ81_000996 [Phrynocephalus forsythii]|uniref:Uncharacterized protein n=1 Tax=Phrynocephalus forsythii TaxID=171643 RepID=A0A9Q1B8J4_9SAUR|nr:hypothetical protein JRQ81_000996 [Phrynocephalus forsythii]